MKAQRFTDTVVLPQGRDLVALLESAMATGRPYSVTYWSENDQRAKLFQAQGRYERKSLTKANHASGAVAKRDETNRPVDSIFITASTLKEKADGTKVNWGRNLRLSAITAATIDGKHYVAP